MANIADTLPATIPWNDRAAVFAATKMLMGERREVERVVEFLIDISALIEDVPVR